MITAIVVDHLCTKFQNDASVNIAYLYCNFRRQYEQKLAYLLASLLKQLVQEQPSMPESVKSLYERHKEKRTCPSFDDISKVLHSIITNYSKTFLIIDALDECHVSNGGRSRLLSEIFNLQAKSGASVFATSRFNDKIMRQFEGALSLEIRANDEDVQRYLGGRISQTELCVLNILICKRKSRLKSQRPLMGCTFLLMLL